MYIFLCCKLFLLCLCIVVCLTKPVQDVQGRDLQRYELIAKPISADKSGEIVLNLIHNLPSELADTFLTQVPPDVICQAVSDKGNTFTYKLLNDNEKYYDIHTKQIIDSSNIIGHYQKVKCVDGLGHTICERKSTREKRHGFNNYCKFPLSREEPRVPGAAGPGNGGNGNNYNNGNNENGHGRNNGNRQGQIRRNGYGGNNGNNGQNDNYRPYK